MPKGPWGPQLGHRFRSALVFVIVYCRRNDDSGENQSEPPSLRRTVLTPAGERVEAEVGYALQCCLRWITAALAAGISYDKSDERGASPDAASKLSSASWFTLTKGFVVRRSSPGETSRKNLPAC